VGPIDLKRTAVSNGFNESVLRHQAEDGGRISGPPVTEHMGGDESHPTGSVAAPFSAPSARGHGIMAVITI